MNFEVVLASTNPHKVKEYREILSKHGITVYSFSDLNLDLPDVKEDGNTFEENAIKKALSAAKYVRFPVIADDSGLSLKALKGFPGIKTARFAKECGNQINANKEIIKRLEGKSHEATFTCVIALANLADKPLIFEGVVKGKISDIYKGETSFGYDPIFIPDGKSKTFYHIDKKIKNEISHRALACKKLITTLKINNLI
ncbi:MAG: RdgB/HAM1 family non-canonical purine NTP pyrophosphatase [Bacilli bacterium]|nr:RdgB/HAM1 family non-canonical purine NTP pyrophosphatase [Bacilli bacterium]